MADQTYCSQADLTGRKGTQRIAELTGDGSGQAVDSAKVTEAIEEFAGKINAAVRRQYQALPFDETNDLLNGLNIEGAYLLLVRDSDRGWTDADRKDWEMLKAEVRDIADGRSELRIETDVEADAMTEGYFSSNKQVFGRGQGL